MNSTTLNSIKTFFTSRNRHYQAVSKIESTSDEDTSCLEEKALLEDTKSSISHSKPIDEIVPLINNDSSFSLKNLSQPINAYTHDTRPDLDILDC